MAAQNSNEELLQALKETSQKVEASLLPSIQSHVSSSDFEPNQGLDFLDTKNTLLLSYLIDLTVHLRNRLTGRDSDDTNKNINRLTEMKIVLDKMRGLDKKLRYQIDKLLSAGTTASSFAQGAVEDPLQFRPGLEGEEDSSDDDDDSAEREDKDKSDHNNKHAQDEEDLDDDLAAARMTVIMAKDKTKEVEKEESGLYRAPRLSAVPYTHDKVDQQAEREKRSRRRMRASEMAQTLRSQFGEAPEQEDVFGGSELGHQREAARRVAEKSAEKTRFEEDTMVRLTVTRKEKKEKKRVMRDESSNLAAIADLGNVVRGIDYGRDQKKEREPMETTERYSSGKRSRTAGQSGKEKSFKSNNSLQAAMFGGGGGKKKSKKSKSR
jgi:U3 small nucleolar ribonucleoprotein protein LCP5